MTTSCSPTESNGAWSPIPSIAARWRRSPRVLRDEYGVGPGDRVAILAANCPEWIVTFWAAVSLGAIAVGLNGWWVGTEIRYGIADCGPKVLVADRKRLDRLEGEDPGVPTIVIEDDFDRIWHAYPDEPLPDVPIAEDDPALILYTSGTTGRPKGAVNTHRNVIAAIGMSFFHGARHGDVASTRSRRRAEPADLPARHLSALPRLRSAHGRGRVHDRRASGRCGRSVASTRSS